MRSVYVEIKTVYYSLFSTFNRNFWFHYYTHRGSGSSVLLLKENDNHWNQVLYGWVLPIACSNIFFLHDHKAVRLQEKSTWSLLKWQGEKKSTPVGYKAVPCFFLICCSTQIAEYFLINLFLYLTATLDLFKHVCMKHISMSKLISVTF